MSTVAESDVPPRVTSDTDASRWLVLCPAALLLVAMWPTIGELVGNWFDSEDYRFGFIIAAISIVWTIVWLPRALARGHSPDMRMLAPLLGVMLLWFAWWQGNSALGAQLQLPLAIWLCLAASLGIRAAWVLAAPIGYLYFAVPIWGVLLPILQQVAIFGAKSSMQLAGISVSVSGANVTIPEGTFEVLYECSGLRFLLVSVALAFLMACIDGLRWQRAAMLLGITAVLAIVANWVRIFVVMYAGHITKMAHYFITEGHSGIGNVIFAVLLVVIFFVSRRLQGGHPAAQPVGGESTVAVARSPTIQWKAPAFVAVFVLSGLVGALVLRTAFREAEVGSPQLQPFPAGASENWLGPLPTGSEWSPRYADAHQAAKAAYRPIGVDLSTPISDVHTYVNVYGVQQRGKELVYFANTLLAPGKWQYVRSYAGMTAGGLLGPRLIVDEYRTGSDSWLVGQTYSVGGSVTPWEPVAQLLYGFSTLTNPAPAGVIAVAVRCGADCDAAYDLMKSFWRDMSGSLLEAVPNRMTVARATEAL